MSPPASTSPTPLRFFPFKCYVKKPITKKEWWNVISSELTERTAVTASCLHCTIQPPVFSPGYWLELGCGTRRASCMWTQTIYVHARTRTEDKLSILPSLTGWAPCFVALLVHDSHTKSQFPGVSMQGICLIATFTFCRQCLEQNFKKRCQNA